MKWTVVFSLIFVMLGYVLTLIWTDVRSDNVKQYFAKHISSESDGPVYAEAHVKSYQINWIYIFSTVGAIC